VALLRGPLKFLYNDAVTAIYRFVWNEFCDWYVELAKFQLQEGGERASAARAVLSHVLDRSLKLLHPVCPYITEELWGRLREAAPCRETDPAAAAPDSEQLILAEWPKANEKLIAQDIEDAMALVQEVTTAVRNIRSQRDVPPKESVPIVVSCAEEATAKTLDEHAGLVAALARAEPVEVGVELARPEDAAAAVLTKAQVFVKIAVDVAAETERLKKQLAKEEAYLAKLEGKLRNQNYLDRAPKDVVERDRAARAEALGRVQQLRDNLAALG